MNLESKIECIKRYTEEKEKEFNGSLNDFFNTNSKNVKGGVEDSKYDDVIKRDSHITTEYTSYDQSEPIPENLDSENVMTSLIEEKKVDTYRACAKLPLYHPNSYSMFFSCSKDLKDQTVMDLTSVDKTHAHNTGGLFDKRMGPIQEGSTCSTCYKNFKDCSTHSAWLPFKKKIFNPTTFLDNINTCKCMCWFCYKPLIPEELIQILGLNSLKGSVYRAKMAEYRDKLLVFHNHGGYKHENFLATAKNHRSGKMVYEKASVEKSKFIKEIETIEMAYNRLTPDQLKMLGFNGLTHPKSFIMDGILVVPSRLRLPAMVNESRMEHFLTQKYIELFKINSQIDKTMKTEEQGLLLSKLYDKVYETINGSTNPTYAKSSKAILQILSGKEGLARFVGQGKRCDNTFRFVASTLTKSDVDQVGIPESVANEIPYTVNVHKFNIDQIRREINEGLYIKAIVNIKGQEVTISLNKSTVFSPEIGNKMLRPIQDGDIVFVGRQPSLHKGSTYAGRAKVYKDSVIRIPPGVTLMTNCDFDGDELHGTVPTTSDSKIEFSLLASVPSNVINEEANKTMVPILYDGILFAYMATQKWVHESEVPHIKRNVGESYKDFAKRLLDNAGPEHVYEFEIPKRLFPEILCNLKYSHRVKSYFKRCKLFNINPYSGRAILSLSFPENLTYISKDIEIKSGILVKGTLKSSNLKNNYGSLVQIIFSLFSVGEAARFVSDFTHITNWMCMWANFSCSHHSFVTNQKEIRETLEIKLNKLQTEFYNLGPEPTDVFDLFEWKRTAHTYIDESLMYAKNVGNSYLPINNEVNSMASDGSGAKGSSLNISQVTAFLSIQRIKGDFQKREFNNDSRFLPTYLPGDCSLGNYVFIANSFSSGLSLSDCYGHSCSGREGLLNTSAKTPEAGQTGRRIQKSAENIIDDVDGIKTTTGKYFAFLNTGISPGKEMFIETNEIEKTTFFADVKLITNYVNGLYEHIDKLMEEGNVEDDDIDFSSYVFENCYDEYMNSPERQDETTNDIDLDANEDDE